MLIAEIQNKIGAPIFQFKLSESITPSVLSQYLKKNTYIIKLNKKNPYDIYITVNFMEENFICILCKPDRMEK